MASGLAQPQAGSVQSTAVLAQLGGLDLMAILRNAGISAPAQLFE